MLKAEADNWGLRETVLELTKTIAAIKLQVESNSSTISAFSVTLLSETTDIMKHFNMVIDQLEDLDTFRKQLCDLVTKHTTLLSKMEEKAKSCAFVCANPISDPLIGVEKIV